MDRKHFGDTREPFALTVAGEKLYVLTSPQDVADSFRNTHSLSYDEFVEDLIKSIGVSNHGLEQMYRKFAPSERTLHHPNPRQKCLAHLTVDFHKHQLLPGEPLWVLSDKFLHCLDMSLRWEKMDQKYVLEETRGDHKRLSLLSWCSEVLVRAGTDVFFGEHLLRSDPTLPQTFYEFDKNAWMLLYRYPQFLSRGMSSPLMKIRKSLTNYFKLPQSQRPGATWFTQTLEAEQRLLGMTDEDIAATMILIHWGFVPPQYSLLTTDNLQRQCIILKS